MHKILYSPGWGAGWSTGAYDAEQSRFMLTYQPLIDALEAGVDIGYREGGINLDHAVPGSVLAQFVDDFYAKFGNDEHVSILGARDLAVTTVNGPFQIDEYDGNEGIILQSQQRWINLDKETS